MLKLDRQVLKKLAGKGVQSPLALRNSLSEVFHENTKLTPLSGRAYSIFISKITQSSTAKQLMAYPYKVYSFADQVKLKPVEPQNDLERIIAARRSERSFTGEPISQEELSKLLFYTYGRTDGGDNFRAVASAGALYPLELYAVALNITGLERGIYHYNVEHHCLDVIERGDRWAEVKGCVGLQFIDVETVSMILVITAIFLRSTMKYQDRGYRMILMEAGEAAQNLSLLATSLGLGSCLLGAFHDNTLGTILGIDGVDEAPLLPVVIGRRPPSDLTAADTEERNW